MQRDLHPAERGARAHDDGARLGLEPHDIERIVGRAVALTQRQATTLAHGEMNDAVVAADHATLQIDDLAGLDRLGPELLHDSGVVAAGHEADVLAVGLLRHRQVEALGQRPRLALGQMAERKAQVVELLLRRAEQEVALIACRIGAAMQFRPRLAPEALNIVAGRQRLGTEVACGPEQVAELHGAIAGDAGHRRLAAA